MGGMQSVQQGNFPNTVNAQSGIKTTSVNSTGGI